MARLCAPTTTYSTPREFNDSRNSLKSLLRRLVQKLDQDLQSFIAGKLFVKLAIGFFRLGKIAKLLYRSFHSQIIAFAANLSE